MIPTALNYITRGIQTCEASGLPSINYRFEMGLTFFINHEFSKAADIFEILWRRYIARQSNITNTSNAITDNNNNNVCDTNNPLKGSNINNNINEIKNEE